MLFDNTSILFILFSTDFENYEITKQFNLKEILNNEYNKRDFINYFYIPLFAYSSNNDIYKINKNKIALLISNPIFIIKLNNNLIFSDKKILQK